MTYMQLGQTDMMVSPVGLGGCVVGGEYPDKGDLEEIFKVPLDYFQCSFFSLLVRRCCIEVRCELY